MSERFSRSFSPQRISSRLGRLRKRGRDTLLAALGAPAPLEELVLPPKPALRGELLASHHLTLALRACRTHDESKPTAFAKLRLLTNKLEQGQRQPGPVPGL